MKYTVHYEENLFYIDAKLKILAQGLSVGIDPGLFKENVLQDLHFVDQTLNRIFTSLQDTPNIRQIDLYYKLLLHSKNNLINLLERILKGDFALAEEIEEEEKDHFTTLVRNHKTDIAQIREGSGIQEEATPEDMISGAELDFLLASHPEEDPS